MTHTYSVMGMTCGNCEAKVKSALLSMPHILSAEVSKKNNSATIEMDKHISLADLQKALGGESSQFKIEATHHNEIAEQTKSWFNTYKPVLLIFLYITGVSIATGFESGNFLLMRWMNHFMGGFFLVFSFFKLLDIKGFAESYSMYDIIAKRWNGWGYIYTFMELVLGIAFLINFNPLLTNVLTLVIMMVSIIGVLQSYFSKRKIKCACLGTVFNLPMSTITIAEDAVMILMSTATLMLMI